MCKQTMLFSGDKSSPKDLKVGNVVHKTSTFSVLSVKCGEFLAKDFFLRVILLLTHI